MRAPGCRPDLVRATFARTMTGLEILDMCKMRVYAAWRHARDLPAGDDLAAFVYANNVTREIDILFGSRQDILHKLIEEGVDFSNNPEVQSRASDNNPMHPMPSIGIWVFISQDSSTGKREVFVTRFIEPVLRIGNLEIGQA